MNCDSKQVFELDLQAMQGIKHIIFDLGNVILNIDYNATINAFEALGAKDFGKIFSKEQQNSISDDIETGKISNEEFFAYCRSICATGTTDAQILNAWNAIIVSFPIRRLQILQQLQLHYDMFLLSNTNAIHEVCYNKLLQDTCGFSSMGVFFDKLYLSHKIGLRKPDVRTWQLILDENNLKPEHTLFLDDSIQHIEAAKTLGIQCIHITDAMTMENDVFKTAAL